MNSNVIDLAAARTGKGKPGEAPRLPPDAYSRLLTAKMRRIQDAIGDALSSIGDDDGIAALEAARALLVDYAMLVDEVLAEGASRP